MSISPSDPNTSTLLGKQAASLRLSVELDGQAQIVELAERKITLGCDSSCTVQIPGEGHPVHAIILCGPEQIACRCWAPDTWLNGQSFSDAVLSEGDEISFAYATIRLLPDQESTPEPTAEPTQSFLPPEFSPEYVTSKESYVENEQPTDAPTADYGNDFGGSEFQNEHGEHDEHGAALPGGAMVSDGQLGLNDGAGEYPNDFQVDYASEYSAEESVEYAAETEFDPATDASSEGFEENSAAFEDGSLTDYVQDQQQQYEEPHQPEPEFEQPAFNDAHDEVTESLEYPASVETPNDEFAVGGQESMEWPAESDGGYQQTGEATDSSRSFNDVPSDSRDSEWNESNNATELDNSWDSESASDVSWEESPAASDPGEDDWASEPADWSANDESDEFMAPEWEPESGDRIGPSGYQLSDEIANDSAIDPFEQLQTNLERAAEDVESSVGYDSEASFPEGEDNVSNETSYGVTGESGNNDAYLPMKEEDLAFSEPEEASPVDAASILARFGAGSEELEPEPAPKYEPPPVAAESDDDDSINDYMQQLLARSGGKSMQGESTDHPASASGSPVEMAQPVEDVEEEVELEPLTSLPPVKKRAELATDLAAMRALANDATRTAIHRHEKTNKSKFAKMKILSSIAMVLGAGILLQISQLETNMFLLGALLLLGFAAFTGLQGVSSGVVSSLIKPEKAAKKKRRRRRRS